MPLLNNFFVHYFTGRSDNFDPGHNSGNPKNARFDTEGMRISNDGLRVYISDEYGPYVYEFDRLQGVRRRSFQLPSSFFVSELSPMGAVEIADNSSGRVANKGMEGLAITPDGKQINGPGTTSQPSEKNRSTYPRIACVIPCHHEGLPRHIYTARLWPTINRGAA